MKKAELLELLREMPEELDIDKLLYTLYVRHQVELALADKAEGRVYTQEQIEHEISSWFK